MCVGTRHLRVANKTRDVTGDELGDEMKTWSTEEGLGCSPKLLSCWRGARRRKNDHQTLWTRERGGVRHCSSLSGTHPKGEKNI